MTTPEYTTWQLAHMAGVSDPDSHDDSPGAKFLRNVESTVDELHERITDNGEDESDAIHELADALVPVYTHKIWKVFVDLAAWQVDTDDLTGGADDLDMEKRAQIALYEVARTLLSALYAETVEDIDE